MKSVMISIKPKYCELIASGKKTIEVRKTKPKLNTPFKCYIYCTKAKMVTKYVFRPEDYPEFMRPDKPVFCKVPDASSPFCSTVNGNGKIIGEFVCDNIFPMSITYSDPNNRIAAREFSFTCLTYKQIIDYLGNVKRGYGWHISDLVIYDKPKELEAFTTFCDANKKRCANCKHYLFDNDDLNGYRRWCDVCHRKPLTRPPQSWRYIEGVEE